jgi:hypothetical protein
MKNKIISLVLGFMVVTTAFPVQVFADGEDYSSYYSQPYIADVPVSSFNYTADNYSSFNYSAPYTSTFNYTAPAASTFNYTSPYTSTVNYTAPAVSTYDYTSPYTSTFNYTSPSVSTYNYTSPYTSTYNYTAPAASTYNYTSPYTSTANYTAPAVTTYDYTSPYTSTANYTAPQTSTYNYTSPYTSTANYTAPAVTTYDYTSPYTTTNNYTVPNTSTFNVPDYNVPTYTVPTYTVPTYTTPTYTTPTYTTPTYGLQTYDYTTPTYTTPTYTTPTYTVPTYTYTGNGTTYITGTNTTVCSDGLAPVNGSCNRINTIQTTTTTVCSDGLAPVNNSCNRTNTIGVTTNTICSDGLAPVNGSCIRTNTIPMYTYPTYTYTTPTVAYQTCWDGSVLSNYLTCPTQFKVCANGTNIPINQTCYNTIAPIYVAPEVVKFNNVVTSVVTQITNTSGRCNGIGLIANGAPSTGWFEYGETANLGRTTAQARIGQTSTAPFSNVLANLKPTTRYYCRAVMQNQYGIVKGEIVSFVTKAKAVKYVKLIVTPVKTVTKTPVKKPEVICSDGSTVSVKNPSVSTLLNQGEKLISLSVERGEGKMVGDAVVGYKVSYKNLSDARLTGVIFKVTLPQEITYIGSSVGTYDSATRVITLNQDTLDPYAEGMILVTGKIAKDAPIGKSIVTNVYAGYTVPSTNTQDEVTAYVVGSIVPATDVSKIDTGAKHVIGAGDGRSFLPNSLIEWLALIAILFIIFILGRSVYASYKDEEGGAHH